MSYKDELSKSAQKMIDYLDESGSDKELHKEMVVFLNTLGKIGTLSDDPNAFNDYSDSLLQFFESSLTNNEREREFVKPLLIHALQKASFLSFTISKKIAIP